MVNIQLLNQKFDHVFSKYLSFSSISNVKRLLQHDIYLQKHFLEDSPLSFLSMIINEYEDSISDDLSWELFYILLEYVKYQT